MDTGTESVKNVFYLPEACSVWFLTDLTFWNEAEDESQWRDAVSQVMTVEKAALIASMTDPSNANFIRWWAMYRDGDTVTFQDQLFS